MQELSEKPGLPAWDLKAIYPDSSSRDADVALLRNLVVKFVEEYRGRLGSLDDDGLVRAFEAHAKISNTSSRIMVHAYLTFAQNTASTAAQALLASAEELSAEVWGQLVFFELELGRLPGQFSSRMDAYAYFVQKCVQRNAHNLTEELEAYGIEKNLTGVQAMTGLFDEVMGSLSFEDKNASGEDTTFTQETALSVLHHADRAYRLRIYSRFLETVGSQKTVLTSIYNNVLLDHRLDWKRRNYTGAMEPRNLSNQVSSRAVDSMLEIVQSSYRIVRRYYTWKARYAKIDQFTNADIYAPVLPRTSPYDFAHAQDSVIRAYAGFDPQAGSIVSDFFKTSRVDARVIPGKRPGAFCYGASPELDAFVHLNYTGDLRSIQTLAHELGHGLHHQLSRSQNHVNFGTPLVTAETASVFGEILLNELLIQEARSKEEQLALLCAQMEGILATVFRQTVLTRFEERAHAERNSGRVSADRFSELWLEENGKLYGDAVSMVDAYKWGWAYIPHFVHTPFYCYAYSFGQLLVLALYQEFRTHGDSFKSGYMKLLSLGGSRAPAKLVSETVGLNIESDDFWLRAVSFIENMMDRIESIGPGPGAA